MPSLLYPRLDRSQGRTLLAAQSSLDLSTLEGLAALSHPAAAPAPTGGVPAPESQVAAVQSVVRSAARKAGYPSPLSDEQDFDRPCGTALYEVMKIVPADAASEDVWTFLTLVVTPEIGPWRFPNRTEERLLGRPRNVLRRLWWRAWALGPDLDHAPAGQAPFGEDEFVGIMERPSIGGNRRTARAVRDAIWRCEHRNPGIPRSELARAITRRFRAFLAHLCMDAMTDQDLEGLLDEVAERAIAALKA